MGTTCQSGSQQSKSHTSKASNITRPVDIDLTINSESEKSTACVIAEPKQKAKVTTTGTSTGGKEDPPTGMQTHSKPTSTAGSTSSDPSLISQTAAIGTIISLPSDFGIHASDVIVLAQSGFNITMHQMAERYGFQENVVWEIYNKVSSLPRAESLLKSMYDAAQAKAAEEKLSRSDE
ncbi:hypothetical protein BDN67DRAFT_982269 [Paxillus ammoniavirescens]|nr:hypothetical protein BDN67DRAFT_982269 [Paxillus ammoniavirescens]